MYYEYFGLNYPPFKITPDTRLFYGGGNRGAVLDALVYAIKNGEGIIKVISEVGGGKTMLCRMLEEKLPKTIEIVYIVNPHLPPEMVLHAIALEMRLSITPQSNPLQVLHTLHTRLLEKPINNQQVVVFIEEAQEMPLETLEEIRLLSNLETTRHKLLQIVLFGQPELDTNLSTVKMRQLKERITHHFYLEALTRNHIQKYLHFRLQAVGYQGIPLFSSASIHLLTKISKGIIRRINILADKALLAAFADEARIVRPKHIRLAARDSKLPYPQVSKSIGIGLFIIISFILGLWFSPYREYIWTEFIHYSQTALSTPLEKKTSSALPEKVLPADKTSLIPSKKVLSTISPSITTNSLLQQRIQATEQWLAQVDKQYYSIQVMRITAHKTENLVNFLSNPKIQPLLEELYIYRVNRKGQEIWEMTYSEFANIDLAMEAMATLPQVLQQNKPFLRKIIYLH